MSLRNLGVVVDSPYFRGLPEFGNEGSSEMRWTVHMGDMECDWN